jgi:hypothetical protein
MLSVVVSEVRHVRAVHNVTSAGPRPDKSRMQCCPTSNPAPGFVSDPNTRTAILLSREISREHFVNGFRGDCYDRRPRQTARACLEGVAGAEDCGRTYGLQDLLAELPHAWYPPSSQIASVAADIPRSCSGVAPVNRRTRLIDHSSASSLIPTAAKMSATSSRRADERTARRTERGRHCSRRELLQSPEVDIIPLKNTQAMRIEVPVLVNVSRLFEPGTLRRRTRERSAERIAISRHRMHMRPIGVKRPRARLEAPNNWKG